MKKLIVIIMLFAVAATFCAFAEEPETVTETETETVTDTEPEAVPETAGEPEPEAAEEKAPEAVPETASATVPSEAFEKKTLIESVQIGAGFDLFTAKGKFTEGDTAKSSSKNGLGFTIATTIDLSAIPHFLKEGWYSYVGFDLFFSKKMTFFGNKYPADGFDLKSSFGYKLHFAVLYHTTFDTAFDFYLGGGLAYASLSGRIETSPILSTWKDVASSWGIAVHAEGNYKLGKHFAVCVTINPDITLFTKLQSRVVDDGLVTLQKRTSFGFGFDLSTKAGIKYIF